MVPLKNPVIIIGAPRSGTTMLFRALSSATGMCGWYEPATTWRIGHAYRGADNADEKDAKPWVRRRIRRAFERFQDQHHGNRIVEKTPHNALRVRFVHAVFPEAKIVHIYRDGRANLQSLVEQYETFKTYEVTRPWVIHRCLMTRLRHTPWWEWPAYLPRAMHGVIRTYGLRRPVDVWGVRYAGWRRDLNNGFSRWQFAAKQWVVAVETALADLELLPQAKWLSVRYEDIVGDSRQWFSTIADFCEVKTDDAFIQKISQSVHADSVSRWQESLCPQGLEEAMTEMSGTLQKLGYI